MIKFVENFIKENKLIEPNSTIVIALSGGVDSMVLFHLMRKLNYNVVVAHVNHKVRLESETEEKYIKELCQNENIPLEIIHLEKIDKNFEAEAHNKRYSFFLEVCKKYNSKYLLTAHHADDNIETIFLNLMSGSNLYGYGGISKKLVIRGINVIRPLLLLSKKDIKAYALQNNITYFEDYTNQSDDYARNRIRHHIIPMLKNECPNILEKANSFSKQIHEAFDFARECSTNFLSTTIYDAKVYIGLIEIDKFKKLHPYIKKDVICLMLEQENIERNEHLINDIINVIESDKPQIDYDLKGNFIFRKLYNNAYITQKNKKNAYYYEINNFDDKIKCSYYNIYFSKEKPKNGFYINLCYNDIVFPLKIRNRMNGDIILLPGGHKKLKDLFIDKKVPQYVRDDVPIILDGNNDILCAVGIAKSKNLFKYKDNGDCYLVAEVIERC